MALIHGGQRLRIAKQFNIDEGHWLDLSTGIAPYSYPIPEIPQRIYQELPQAQDNLNRAAQHYYNATNVLATHGSQTIIKLLPQLWCELFPASTRVYVPEQGYKEHALAWQSAGFSLRYYQEELPPLSDIEAHDVLVIINPNNPTGKLYQRSQLERYQSKMVAMNGLLVLDEAFMDVITPSQSMTTTISNYKHTIVLRSFGKFFGLAGIRIGFLLAQRYWINLIHEKLGPWQVNGPAQYIAEKALADKSWQQTQQSRLQQLSQQLNITLLDNLPSNGVINITGTALFQTVYFNNAIDVESYYVQLCQQAIYVRLTDDNKALRFGLAKPEQLERLAHALLSLNH
ncbi:threonine-phosphate decarboxylase CobD [Litorilituus lipolyticus]|uniref:threonine-phosphate decarboxylase CobD n=1 Tax=Litorilituus lipolyticus TaxID=2491017 RepID=UPI001478F22C|nr:threonine-phosphate decarboxylase CobD [Litorilituus lipolyticus]